MCIERVWKVPFCFFKQLCSVERRKLCIKQCPGLCVGREQQCKAIAQGVMLDSWIKIQTFTSSAWQMQRNFIILELEESQLSLKVVPCQSCPSKGTVRLASVLIAPGGYRTIRVIFQSFSCLLGPAVPCLAHWCDTSHLDLVTECVRSSQSSPWSFQVLFP